MRSMQTIIARIIADLPITDEEAEAANMHLDKLLRQQKILRAVAFSVPLGALIVLIIYTVVRRLP